MINAYYATGSDSTLKTTNADRREFDGFTSSGKRNYVDSEGSRIVGDRQIVSVTWTMSDIMIVERNIDFEGKDQGRTYESSLITSDSGKFDKENNTMSEF